MHCQDEQNEERLITAERLWLFLDYDGTLAEFAETPDQIIVQPEIVNLLTRLVRLPGVRATVVSGRRLDQIRKLVPVPGVLLAGTYGLEGHTFEGEDFRRLDYERVRPILEELKPSLKELIAEEEGFFLEDKGWSLALHARYADEATSERILQSAQQFLSDAKVGDDFVVLGGHKFLEICPISGNKGETVRYLLSEYPWPGALHVYMGDDDKDEEAFRVIKEFGGVTIHVVLIGGDSQADCQLEDPEAVRSWLDAFIHRRENERANR